MSVGIKSQIGTFANIHILPFYLWTEKREGAKEQRKGGREGNSGDKETEKE